MMKLLLEMALLGKGYTIKKDKKNKYRFDLHGGTDCIYPPHVHIYQEKTRNEFTIEVNLAHYLSTGCVRFCRIYDKTDNIRDRTSQDDIAKYSKCRQFVDLAEDFLVSKPNTGDYQDARDGLEASLRAFADESDLKQLRNEDIKRFTTRYGELFTNMPKEAKILFVLLSMNSSIMKSFYDYFPEDLRNKFPLLFK